MYTNPFVISNGLNLNYSSGTVDADNDKILFVNTDGDVVSAASLKASRISNGGSLTEATSSVLTITGTSTLLAGTTIQVKQASALQGGYLSSTDWSTFNNKLSSSLTSAYIYVGNGSNVATAVPVTGDIGISNTGLVSITSNSIVNADINSSAAIAFSKMAPFANTAVAAFTDGAGFITTYNALTTTIAGYLSNISSDVQSQLNSKLTVTLTSPASGDVISYNGSTWVNAPAGAGVPSGGTTSQYLRKINNTNYNTEWHTLVLADLTDVTALAADVNILTGLAAAGLSTTELSYVNGVTSPIQTQFGNKLDRFLPYNALFVGDAGNIPVSLAPGTDGYVLTMVAGVPGWAATTPPGNVSSATAPSIDNELVRYNGTIGDSIQGGTGIIISDSGQMLFPNAGAIRTNTSAGNTLLFQAYDVDGTSYTTFATLTANNTPTFDLATSVTIASAYIYRVGGTDVSLADGGTGSSLSDPGANRLWGWDDTDNAITFFTIGTNLSYDHATHTLSATGGGGSGDVSGPGSSTDNAIVRFDSTTGKIIQNSVGILGDTGDLSGIANLTMNNGGALQTATSNGNTLLLQAYDVDGTSYTTFATLTAANTPTMDLSTAVTMGGSAIYRVGGTDVSLADGGTGASLADPNADRILFWDDSAGMVTWLSPGTTLAITSTTLDVATNGITNTELRQSGALSVIGRSSNSTGDVADISAGSDGNILRRSGTTLAFGTIDLASSGAVGTSILGVANGGIALSALPSANQILAVNNAGTAYEGKTLSVSTTAVSNDVGVTLTGANAIVINVPSASGTVRGVVTTGTQTFAGFKTFSGAVQITATQAYPLSITGTWTGGANNDSQLLLSGTLTARSTASDNLYGIRFSSTLVASAATQTLVGVEINPTFTPGAFSPTTYALRVTGPIQLNVGSDATGDIHRRSSTGTFSRLALGSALQLLRVNAGATDIEWATISTGGITNAAANNEIMKSDGTNAVASGIFSTTFGDLTLGTSLSGTTRNITAEGSGSNITLALSSKGFAAVKMTAQSSDMNWFGNILQFSSAVSISGLSTIEYSGISTTTLKSSDLGGAGGSANVIVTSGTSLAGTSPTGDVRILTGNAFAASNANSGSIFINPGTPDGTGTGGNTGFFTTSVSDWKSLRKGIFIGNSSAEATAAISSGATIWAFNSILKTYNDIAIIDSSKGSILKSANGHYWRIAVDNAGTITATDLGTSI